IRDNYTLSSTVDREVHTLVDFMIGKEVGIGGLDASTVSAGVRYGDFGSTTGVNIAGQTHWDMPVDAANPLKYTGPARVTFDGYEGALSADRTFKGAGPVLSWEASKTLLGGADSGVLGLDWSLTGGVLFGHSTTTS